MLKRFTHPCHFFHEETHDLDTEIQILINISSVITYFCFWCFLRNIRNLVWRHPWKNPLQCEVNWDLLKDRQSKFKKSELHWWSEDFSTFFYYFFVPLEVFAYHWFAFSTEQKIIDVFCIKMKYFVSVTYKYKQTLQQSVWIQIEVSLFVCSRTIDRLLTAAHFSPFPVASKVLHALFEEGKIIHYAFWNTLFGK